MKIKTEQIKKLGFKKYLLGYYLRIKSKEYPYWSLSICYDGTTKSFYCNGVDLNINSISELKTFLNYFITK